MEFSYEPNLTASGNISPCRFIKGDVTQSFQCLQAGVGDAPIGVSGSSTHQPSGTPADDGFHAILNGLATVYKFPSIVPLTAGGTWTPYCYLKPDATGQGLATTTATDIIGAIALQSAVAGDKALVMLVPPMLLP